MGPGTASVRSRQRINIKGVEYIVEEERERTPSVGSHIAFFKNGEPQGTAYEDIWAEVYYPRRTYPNPSRNYDPSTNPNPNQVYYPAASLFKAAVVTFNFGPTFAFPPGCEARPVCELANLGAAAAAAATPAAAASAPCAAATAPESAAGPVDATAEPGGGRGAGGGNTY